MTVRRKLRKLVRDPAGFVRDSPLGRLWPSPKLPADDRPVALMFSFSLWKRELIKDFLPEYRLLFLPRRAGVARVHRAIRDLPDKVFIVWSFDEPPGVVEYAAAHGIGVIRAEDGFLRSVELGAHHSRPLSICFDRTGLYFDSRGPSDLETLLATYDFAGDPGLLALAGRCLARIRALEVSKYNPVPERDARALLGEKTRPRVLVAGQVEDDASIRFGSARQYTNNDIVWLARLENPDAEILYRPHPDVLAGKRPPLSDPQAVADVARLLDRPLALDDALRTVDRVYTITSLVGFEALIRGLRVTTFGAPFYSGWGLTDDRQPVARRGRRLTLEQVFAAAYILYPRYVDPLTRRPIDAEAAIEILAQLKRTSHADPLPETAGPAGRIATRAPEPAIRALAPHPAAAGRRTATAAG